MAKEIELPDGSIAEFPDNMGDDAIGAVLSKQFGQPKPTVLKKSIGQQAVDAFQPQNIAKAGYGAMETATQMATAIPGQIAGGWRGITSLLSGEGLDEATRKIRGTEEAMTWQPRTESGQALSGALGAGMEAINKGVGKVGQAVGGDVGEAIGEVALPVAGTLFGGGAALRGAKGVTTSDVLRKGKELATDVAETPALVQSQLTKKAPPTKAQVERSMQTADTIDITNRGMDLGLKVDPASTTPTFAKTTARAIAGPEELNEALSTANRAKGTEILKRDLGIAPNAQINMDTIRAMRDQADLPNQHIRNLGNQVTVDAPTVGELQRLKIERPVVGEEAAAGQVNRLVDSMSERINSGQLTAPEIMEHVRVFRENARDLRSKNELTTADRQLADTNRAMADALEESVARNLQRLTEENPTHGYDRLLADFQKGRTDMARSYLLEDILDKPSGQIDFGKLAKEVGENQGVTGELRTVGEFAGRYPELFDSKGRPSHSFLEKHVFSRTTLPGMIGGSALGPFGVVAGAAANKLLSGAARKALTSDKAQQAGRLIDYRPAELRNTPAQSLIREDVPAPGPRPFGRITMAEEGPLPTTRANVEPQVRPTMEMAPMEAQSAALRGQPARIPLREGDVEFTPGGGQDFMLRQEVMQTPEVVQITNQARAQMADLENKIANSQGFWKQKYQAELADLQQQFGTMMESIGVRTPQEAIGLQPLYEGQTQGRLPVQKSADPRSTALRRNNVPAERRISEGLPDEVEGSWLK